MQVLKDEQKPSTTSASAAITRREFIQFTGAVILVAGAGGCRRSAAEASPTPANASASPGAQAPTSTPVPTRAPTSTLVPTPSVAPTSTVVPGAEQILVPTNGIPPADGYLLVDVGKCQGCANCMLACSLIHEGVESLSLSRIQVLQDSFAPFPGDLTVEQCRQCVDPACVKACPTGALQADARYGSVRTVDAEQCIGCGACHSACPYVPSRAFLSADRAYRDEVKSLKCDLCAEAPYHWDEAGGGPGGKQACVAVCPVGAIAFTTEIPEQDGDGGYRVNLRGQSWAVLGYPVRGT
jgi:protein NrfC